MLTEAGAGYSSRQQTEVIKTTHAAFRPIDAKMGPDGALYIADWYNPIIQHGEVDFRDERRDHTHGRIWRVTVKGSPLVERPKLVDASVEHLLESLRAPEDFTRLHAKLQLKRRGPSVVPKLAAWIAGLDAADPDFEHLRLEGLWTYQALDVVEPDLLSALLHAKDHHVRAAATRVLEQWHSRLGQTAALLAEQADDPHPQVRLEAVHALTSLRTAPAAELATHALDHPMDRFLDHALWLTARDLQPYWLPALQAGQLSFGGNAQHLAYVLQAAGSPGVVGPLMDLLRSGKLPAERRESTLLLIAALGGPPELRVVFDMALDANDPPSTRAALLTALAKATRIRKVQPAGDLQSLTALVDQPDETLRIAAIEAAGLWRLETSRERLQQFASSDDTSPAVRRAALDGLAVLGAQSAPILFELSRPPRPAHVRTMAIAALATVDVKAAAREAVALMREVPVTADPESIITAMLDRKAGAAALVEALGEQKLSEDAAKLALRAVRATTREEPALMAALTAAAGIQAGPRTLTPDEIAALVFEVAGAGDPARGEMVFRRGEQSCLKCHAIAGAGGRVGPDLVSIGASAQVDYLIESILQPSAKIKENYHSLVVVADGRITSGIKARETDKELVLRDVVDREIAIPLDAIEEKKEGGSLMPVGLSDGLTRGELIDLVRFLSELGKVGPYASSKAAVARRWQALVPSTRTIAKIEAAGPEAAIVDARGEDWTTVYSKVSGNLPLASIPAIETKQPSAPRRIVRCQLDVATPGKADLLLSGPIEGLWLDTVRLPEGNKQTVDLAAGPHTVTVLLGLQSAEELRLELADIAGSTAQVQIVGGK